MRLPHDTHKECPLDSVSTVLSNKPVDVPTEGTGHLAFCDVIEFPLKLEPRMTPHQRAQSDSSSSCLSCCILFLQGNWKNMIIPQSREETTH